MSNGSEREPEDPKQKAVHHSYVVPGLTDGQVMKTQAEKYQLKGYTTWVHQHPRIEPCNDNCREYGPKKDV